MKHNDSQIINKNLISLQMQGIYGRCNNLIALIWFRDTFFNLKFIHYKRRML
jgi:hypothetical protein